MVKSERIGYYPDVGGEGLVKETPTLLAQRKKTVREVSFISVEECVGNNEFDFSTCEG